MTYAIKLNGQYLDQDGAVTYPGSGGNGFKVAVVADGTGFSNAEPLIRTMNTLMTQGSWETLGPFSNRAPALVVEIEGLTADGLNAGEVWLSNLMGRGELEWLPPGHTVWTVFDVVWCYIDRSYDDNWDLAETRWVRRYLIPIKALPSARSPELTVTDAEPTAGTALIDVLISDGSSATGWTADWYRPSLATPTSGAITPTVVSGAVRATQTTSKPVWHIRETHTFTATPATTPYIRVDLKIYAGTLLPEAYVAGTSSPPITVNASLQNLTALGGGVIGGTVYYKVPTGTTSIRVGGVMNPNTTNTYVEVDQVRRVSRLPDLGTFRQKIAAIYPGGSAPADGSLHVGHATQGLGKAIVYTYPLGRPSPALMQYRTGGTTPTTDTTQINGARTLIQAANLVLTVPDQQLPIRGLATLWAKMQVDTDAVTVRWIVTPMIGGTTVGKIQTGDVVVPVGTTLLVPLGLVTLPGAVTGSTGSHVITLRNVGAGSGVASVDEVWALGLDEDSALTIVDAGAGTPVSGGASNHLWINAPTAEKPAGEILIGTGLADARWPSVFQAGPQVHKFPSKGVSVLTVTTSATDASTDFTHFKRWTHHAAETS